MKGENTTTAAPIPTRGASQQSEAEWHVRRLALDPDIDWVATVHERGQHAKMGRSGWRGPNCYVAVQVCPRDVEPLEVLHPIHAAARGIRIVKTGEGYATSGMSERSARGRAHALADKIAEIINGYCPIFLPYVDSPEKKIQIPIW